MPNIQINISDNGTTTLATAGKYCDRNVDVVVDVQGGGGGDLPPEALVITGNCAYRFANDGWNWFIEQYGNQITTENIDNANRMFYGSGDITSIPFELNFIDGGGICDYLFGNCSSLESIPSIDFKQTSYEMDSNIFNGCNNLIEIGTIKNLYPDSMANFFKNCYRLRNLPAFDNLNLSRPHSSSENMSSIFYVCYSLRNIPSDLLSELYTNSTSASSSPFYNLFYACYVLDKAVGLPVNEVSKIASNMFRDTFTNCCRMKSAVFDTNDDSTVKTANWKSQTIDFAGANVSRAVGVAFSDSYILNYNSGITADKLVRTDEDYQALKNDEDWFTYDISYSRYNHDSAVETINSLPDTSAYLATAGGTNTIKFRGVAGSLTDGGAINTLTAEEIAVATAKGWTVTLV